MLKIKETITSKNVILGRNDRKKLEHVVIYSENVALKSYKDKSLNHYVHEALKLFAVFLVFLLQVESM